MDHTVATDIANWVAIARDVTLSVALGFALWWGRKKEWVWGWQLADKQKDLDEAKEIIRHLIGMHEKTVEKVEQLQQKV